MSNSIKFPVILSISALAACDDMSGTSNETGRSETFNDFWSVKTITCEHMPDAPYNVDVVVSIDHTQYPMTFITIAAVDADTGEVLQMPAPDSYVGDPQWDSDRAAWTETVECDEVAYVVQWTVYWSTETDS